jgi:hypothetical protein
MKGVRHERNCSHHTLPATGRYPVWKSVNYRGMDTPTGSKLLVSDVR